MSPFCPPFSPSAIGELPHDIRRRFALYDSCEHDAAAVLLDDVLFHYFVNFSIGTFHVHVWFDLCEPCVRGGLTEDEHCIYGLEGCYELRALKLGIDGAGGTFVGADGGVGIDTYDKYVAMSLCFLKVAHVAHMKDIEAAVGGHDGLFCCLCRLCES